MLSSPQVRALSLATFLFSGPALALAQAPPSQQPPPPANSPASPAPDQAKNPSLTTATVKLDNGWRAGKMIGSAVYNDETQQIGTIDDLILSNENKVTMAVLSVGGFLGLGSKLVAVPYDHLDVGQDRRMTMPGASKDALKSLPSFTY